MVEGIFPKGYENVEIKNEINKIKEYEKRSIATTWFIIQAKNHSILRHLKQYLFVKIFIVVTL